MHPGSVDPSILAGAHMPGRWAAPGSAAGALVFHDGCFPSGERGEARVECVDSPQVWRAHGAGRGLRL